MGAKVWRRGGPETTAASVHQSTTLALPTLTPSATNTRPNTAAPSNGPSIAAPSNVPSTAAPSNAPSATHAAPRIAPQPPPNRVKRLGSEEHHEKGPHNPALAKRPKLAIDNTAQNIANAAKKLQEKERELQELRKQLAEKERLAFQKKQETDALEAARQQSLQLQREQQRRREALSKAFAAIADAVPAPSAPVAVSGGSGSGGIRPAVAVADAEEVQRVLQCNDDYACLKLHVGASLSQARRSYRQMAMALHPDKCRQEGAAAAFQRVNAAYANIGKVLGA